MTEDKTNQNKQNKKAKQKNKKINRRTQSKRRDKKKIHPTSLPMEVLVNNQKSNQK